MSYVLSSQRKKIAICVAGAFQAYTPMHPHVGPDGLDTVKSRNPHGGVYPEVLVPVMMHVADVLNLNVSSDGRFFVFDCVTGGKVCLCVRDRHYEVLYTDTYGVDHRIPVLGDGYCAFYAMATAASIASALDESSLSDLIFGSVVIAADKLVPVEHAGCFFPSCFETLDLDADTARLSELVKGGAVLNPARGYCFPGKAVGANAPGARAPAPAPAGGGGRAPAAPADGGRAPAAHADFEHLADQAVKAVKAAEDAENEMSWHFGNWVGIEGVSDVEAARSRAAYRSYSHAKEKADSLAKDARLAEAALAAALAN